MSVALRRLFLVLGLFLPILVTSSTNALAIYTYVGNAFSEVSGAYDTAMRVTGFFELDTPLPANLTFEPIPVSALLGWAISDGRETLSAANADFSPLLAVSTSPDGAITAWNFGAGRTLEEGPPTVVLSVTTSLDAFNARDSGVIRPVSFRDGIIILFPASDGGHVADSPGVWTFTPEPGPAALLMLGLVGLGRTRSRERPSQGAAPAPTS